MNLCLGEARLGALCVLVGGAARRGGTHANSEKGKGRAKRKSQRHAVVGSSYEWTYHEGHISIPMALNCCCSAGSAFDALANSNPE
jgi:hypothetical protein